MSGHFYITTPIYYVNDAPHLGTAYTTVAADVMARYQRSKGRDTVFLTGTDEHGQKVFEAAARRGLTPQAHVDDMVKPYQVLWERLLITNDDFIRTTDPRHTRVVQATLQSLFDSGDIFQDTYEGWYSTSAERFWTEKDLVDGKCPDTGTPVEWIAEKNYFFRMGKYADRLRQWVDDHPDFVRPESRKNELLGYLRKDVGDLCISRPKTRLPWGIELPFDPDFVTYVWFDALLNYVSAIDYMPGESGPRFSRFWPASFHFVGKDILTTHAVYWSTMLFAMGLEPARCLYAHGWWTIEGRKMSKSLKNVVDPHLLIDTYGPDAVRYFLMREIAFGADGDFSHQNFLTRYNSDLANDLGNLAHRALSMTQKWLGGVVPPAGPPTEGDGALRALFTQAAADFDAQMEAASLKDALESMLLLVRAGNKYVDTEQPWALNREGKMARLGAVLRNVLEICRIASAMIAPFCPERAVELRRRLSAGAAGPTDLEAFLALPEGGALDVSQPLFPRLQELPAAIQAALDAAAPPADAPAPKKKKKSKKKSPPPEIAFEDFEKVALRAGRVLSAAPHPDADRLLVLSVDVGEPAPRSIVAGIASKFSPEEIVGRSVIVVTNLAPATIRGVASQGMVLAAGDRAILGLAGVSDEIPPGTVIR